jgi:nicotinamide-nucleotide amidase
MKTVDLILIGSELLSGHVQEKNLKIAANLFKETPLRLENVFIVNDSEEKIHRILSQQKSDLCIIAGGLGPTKDDITKKVLANFFKKPLINSKLAKSVVEKQFERRKKSYDPNRYDYHLIPQDFDVLENPIGFAPAFSFKDKYFILPGVPYEFEAILQSIVTKFDFPKRQKHLTMRTFGHFEEEITTTLYPGIWEKLEEYGSLSSLPNLSGVDFILNSKNGESIDYQAVENLCKDSGFHRIIWQYGDLELTEFLQKILVENNKTLSIAESCTGGEISSMVTDIPGASNYFKQSVITYENIAKVKTLGVSAESIEKFSVYSHEVAKEMAQGMRKLASSDYAISTTGVASPIPGDENITGDIYVGVSTPEKTYSFYRNFMGKRKTLKTRFSYWALHMLRENIKIPKNNL